MQVEIKNIEYTYMQNTPMEKKALNGVSFCVRQGEFICIIGHTGSGKSTLIQHINGLLVPNSGEVLVDGMSTADKGNRQKIRKSVGLVFQYPEYQLFEESVEKDIAFGCKNLGMSEEEQIRCVKKAMDMVGLDYDSYAKASPFDLSGGQKRRAAIAGVIAMEPKLLVLDEPTSGLDPKSADEILEMIERLNKSGIGIIMVTHNMNDVYAFASRAIVINEGKVIFDDEPKSVFSHADELLQMGLDVPDACRFAYELRKKGMDIPMDVMETDGLIEAVRKVRE